MGIIGTATILGALKVEVNNVGNSNRLGKNFFIYVSPQKLSVFLDKLCPLFKSL